jgi:hypothetical protein
MVVADMEAAVAAVVSTEEAVVADSMEAAVARTTAAEAGTRVMAAVADVLTDVPAEQLRAHFQGRALMGIGATHMADDLTVHTAADLRQGQRKVVPALLCRREIPATLETRVTAAPETQRRRIVAQPRHQHSLAIQDRHQQVLDQPSVEIAEAGQRVRRRDHRA